MTTTFSTEAPGRHFTIRPRSRGVRIDIVIKSDITAFELAQILSSVELFSMTDGSTSPNEPRFRSPLPRFFYVHPDDMAIFRSPDPINRHFVITEG